ncbi:hypothetical protein N878_01195 [Pseudomonas sp. EGD-AK9]|uniref:hypothetical protein n=1 Tax=Pseudomonas sp. EGD-AK9 TaxID=1386078 RepID=UPI00039846FA|nr:hypothetical protein [Pseudomonas sp. EGD-AK9]ERI52172.1 hypothetical protein N878_01195 [Pseudomonas sp. EGD-AK9]
MAIHEHRLDLEQLRKLELRDGDVLTLPADTGRECGAQFAEALQDLHPDKRVLIVLGDVQSLDEAAMNAAGWYRK